MPESRPPPRLSLRFAAIGTLAGLMVLLPLGEVLRYQTDEIQVLTAERALLDPLAYAVGLQRSLIGHGEVASRVLAGRRQLEDERRLRQAEVDGAVFRLKGTLAAGLWDRALAETDDLAHDWHGLASRIQSGKVDVPASQAGHRLLVEQALQVMDLVSAGADAQQLATLDQARAALMARSLQLDGQLGRLHTARNRQLAGITLLVVMLVIALARAWRQQRLPAPPPQGGDDPGERRGHGRRNTDAPRQIDAAQGLMQQLRQAEPDAASPPHLTLPPRP